MDNKIISDVEFWEQICSVANPETEDIVLCQNPVDMMRMRILLHKHLAKKKSTIFNTNLYTLRMWFWKTIPEYQGAKEIMNNPVQMHAILLQTLDDKSLLKEIPHCRNMVQLSGFQSELIELWKIYHWFNKDNSIFSHPSESNIHSIYSEILIILSHMDRTLKNSRLSLIPEFLHSLPKVQHPNKNNSNNINVHYLFPSHLNITDKKIIDFFCANFSISWNIYATSSKNIDTLKFFSENTRANIQIVDGNFSKKSAKATQPDNSIFFTNNNMNRGEKKDEMQYNIWRASSEIDESFMVARSIYDLVVSGTPRHEILILYPPSQNLLQLQFALAKYGLDLDCPEKTGNAPDAMTSFLLDFIDIVNPTKQSFTADKFTSLIQRPALNIEFLYGTNVTQSLIDNLCKSIEERIHAYKEFSFREIIAILKQPSLATAKKNSNNNNENKQSLKFAIKSLSKLWKTQTSIPSQSLPSVYSKIFAALFESYLTPTFYEDFQIRNLNTVLNNMAKLDTVFPKGVKAEYFFQLFNKELSEHTHPLKVPAALHKSLNKSSENIENSKISARSIQEGVHSPLDYLFIIGMKASSFPTQARSSLLITSADKSREFILQRNYEQQKDLFYSTLEQVNKGCFLSFSLDTEAAPSVLIFELWRKINKNETIKKEIILEQIPVYQANLEKIRLANNDFNTTVSNHYQAKMTIQFNKNRTQFNGDTEKSFRGLEDKAMTALALEDFSVCPQRYWFKRILLVEDNKSVDFLKPIDNLLRGNLFHSAASECIERLMQEFPKTTYHNIFKKTNEKQIKKMLNDSFQAVEIKERHSNINYFPLIYEARMQSLKQDFVHYFLGMFEQCQLLKHPLSNYYPIGVEIAFKEILLGDYKFTGRIDRIDYNPEENIVVVSDYKTGKYSIKSGSEDYMKSLLRAQLPVYMKAISTMTILPANIDKKTLQVNGAYLYVMNKQPGSETIFIKSSAGENFPFNELNQSNFHPDMKLAFDIIHKIDSSGYFFAAPHKLKDDPQGNWIAPCAHCEYAQVCDRSPFSVSKERLFTWDLQKEYVKAIHSLK